MKTINFYSTTSTYGAFSNFARYPIRLDNKLWPTSEHYYQAQKFTDPAYQERIRKAITPKLAATYGRNPDVQLREDWEQVKNDVMLKVLLAKFTQHETLRLLLISTGDSILCEHTTNDNYWGDGGNGSGANMLGKLLMQVRDILSAP